MPGLPAASHFLCFAKESNQRKTTRGSSPRKSAGFPALLETTGRCGTRARMVTAQKVSVLLALRQSSRTSPVVSALLGDSHRDPVDYSRLSLYCTRALESSVFFGLAYAFAGTTLTSSRGRRDATGAPCEEPSSGANAGDVREDCLSGEHKLNLLYRYRFEPRVPQRPAFVSSGGHPKGDEPGVAFSWVTFFWRSKRK